MAKLFDLDELHEQAEQNAGAGILKDNYLDVHLAKVDSIKNLNGRLPLEGEIFFLWTINSFNAFTFIPYMIKQHGQIDELLITTYSMSSRILNALTHYIEKGKIEKVHILISDSVKFRLPKVQDQLVVLCNQRPGQFIVSYAWNHAKITLMKTSQGHYLVEGSGNFSENAQHEQYIFVNSKPVFEFRKQQIHDLLPGTTKED
jgi:hypothetical protein